MIRHLTREESFRFRSSSAGARLVTISGTSILCLRSIIDSFALSELLPTRCYRVGSIESAIALIELIENSSCVLELNGEILLKLSSNLMGCGMQPIMCIMGIELGTYSWSQSRMEPNG